MPALPIQRIFVPVFGILLSCCISVHGQVNNAIFGGSGGDGYDDHLVEQQETNTIFGGGDGDGYDARQFEMQSSSPIFGGGLGDGYHSLCYKQISTNPIFGGGDGDGYHSICFQQQVSNIIFAGGSGDGFSAGCFKQFANSLIFAGGNGDGFSASCFKQQSNSAIYAGGNGDGFSSLCFKQQETNTIFAGGIGDGSAIGCGFEVICNEDSVTLFAQSCLPGDTGTVVNNLTNSDGCDSVVTIITTLLPSDFITINLTSCNPSDTGTVVNTLANQSGCDSVVTEITTLSPSFDIVINATSCNPVDTGTVVDSLITGDGCDSVVTTITTLILSYDITLHATSCNPADTGTSVMNLMTDDGCDSVVTEITTLLPSYDMVINATSCNPADTGTVVDNLTTSDGCDSVVTTIITLNPSYDITINESSCNPADTGTVVMNLTTQQGCDSVVTAVTILLPGNATTINLTSCNPSDTGTVVNTLTNQFGCDSVVTTVTDLVADNTPPNAVCQDVSIQLDNSGTAIILAGDVDAGSTDDCGIDSISLNSSIFDCDDTGQNTVELTVVDLNGNSSSCNATVTVNGSGISAAIVPNFVDKLCQGESVLLSVDATGTVQDYLWSTGETSATIVAADTGLYAVIVTSATNCTDTAYYNLTVDPMQLASSYTIIAQRTVLLRKENVVNSGGVGVMDQTGLARIKNNSSVNSFVKAATVDVSSNSSVADIIVEPASIDLPGFLNNTATGYPVISVAPNQNIVLNDCAYDAIEIKDGAVVTFTCDNVFIGELFAANDLTIQFSGSANLYVREEVVFGAGMDFNPGAEFVYAYMMDRVQVNPGSSITAHLLTRKKLAVNGSSTEPVQMTGQFIARHVRSTNYVMWNWDVNCDPVPGELPPVSIVRYQESSGAEDNNETKLNTLDISVYPNPFMDHTTVQFAIPEEGRTSIQIVDLNGRVMETSDLGTLQAGTTYLYEYQPEQSLGTGTYLVRIVSGNYVRTIKLVYMR